MPILHSLVTKEIRPHGKARICPMRYRPGMEVPGAAAHMPQAQTGNRIGRIGSRGVAVIRRTAQEWGVGV
jgi:hypothetical protein